MKIIQEMIDGAGHAKISELLSKAYAEVKQDLDDAEDAIIKNMKDLGTSMSQQDEDSVRMMVRHQAFRVLLEGLRNAAEKVMAERGVKP